MSRGGRGAGHWAGGSTCTHPQLQSAGWHWPPPPGSQVKAGLVPLLADIRGRGVEPEHKWLEGDYDTAKQVGWGPVCVCL